MKKRIIALAMTAIMAISGSSLVFAEDSIQVVNSEAVVLSVENETTPPAITTPTAVVTTPPAITTPTAVVTTPTAEIKPISDTSEKEVKKIKARRSSSSSNSTSSTKSKKSKEKTATTTTTATIKAIPSSTIESKVDFVDVPKDDWSMTSIDYVVAKGYMEGTSSTTFEPGSGLTRGMFVTILYRMAGVRSKVTTTFKDVDVSAYYAQSVAWAQNEGIVKGYNSESFGPDDPVTREQMATILSRYATNMGYSFVNIVDKMEMMKLVDLNEVSEYAQASVTWAFTSGLLKGRTPSTICPKSVATREEVATIIEHFDKHIAK